jgi:hypothetical protein
MITMFCDFCQFSAKIIGVFLKNQCYDHIFAKTSSSLSKNGNIFAKFFSENIFKIITSVTGFTISFGNFQACPLHPGEDWQEDKKLNLILSKVQEHQQSLRENGSSLPPSAGEQLRQLDLITLLLRRNFNLPVI